MGDQCSLLSDKPRRAVFLDRDGTMGGGGGFQHPDTFEMYPFTSQAVALLKSASYLVVMVSNQVRISTGEITIEQVDASFTRIKRDLRSEGADLDAWYICPHHPDDQCACRKPNPGMLLKAAQDLNIDLSKSYMVGDRGDSDMVAASRAGCRPILTLTGLGNGSIGEFRHTWRDVTPWAVAANLLEAVQIILSRSSLQS